MDTTQTKEQKALEVLMKAMHEIYIESCYVELSHEKIANQRDFCFKIARKAIKEYHEIMGNYGR